jgi:small subunit ribosomal protein S17
MQKSIIVVVGRQVEFKGRTIMRHTKLMVHDEQNACDIGDKVLIRRCRPMSKHKSWAVQTILQKDPSAVFLKNNPEFQHIRVLQQGTHRPPHIRQKTKQ